MLAKSFRINAGHRHRPLNPPLHLMPRTLFPLSVAIFSRLASYRHNLFVMFEVRGRMIRGSSWSRLASKMVANGPDNLYSLLLTIYTH